MSTDLSTEAFERGQQDCIDGVPRDRPPKGYDSIQVFMWHSGWLCELQDQNDEYDRWVERD